MSESVNSIFGRVVVVSLDRKPDRLARFNANVESVEWPFKKPERFRAIDGSKVPVPDRWISGGGAYGCMQSHRQILEACLHDDIKSVLVLEDDAYFPPEFSERVARFLGQVPADWECLMLGGQHIKYEKTPPPLQVEGVLRCVNCQRTHAYGLRGRAIGDLYRRWMSWEPGTTGHCDHIMGPFMAQYKTYAPADQMGRPDFLVAQDDNQSDISGRRVRRVFWNPAPQDQETIYFRGPRPDPTKMRELGFHMGYSIDHVTGVDNGLRAAFGQMRSKLDRKQRVQAWVDELRWEAVALKAKVAVWMGPLEGEEPYEHFRECCGALLKESVVPKEAVDGGEH